MTIPYEPPSFREDGFNCPHCQAYAKQDWSQATAGGVFFQHLWKASCFRCGDYSLWHFEKMVYPDSTVAPPNPDLPDHVQADYREAGSIVDRSPRGAAALLRLAIDKVAGHLGAEGRTVDDKIANLVKRGLSVKIQQALDVLRVVGNNAVHPGELDIRDDRETAAALFQLVNLIADEMISEPKRVQELFQGLPEAARQAIERRNGRTRQPEGE